ncbi:MAG: DUF2127 domain-containing protein [Bacteroidetes bacterium]|nr:DUF2127 domain-containing protein [Bacteroidota bacterium]
MSENSNEIKTENVVIKPKNYLKIIALWKIGKSVLLLIIGFSMVFLDRKHEMLNWLIDWANDEFMLPHSRIYVWLLSKFQTVLSETHFRTSGIIALFYSVILAIEGIGVYNGKHWAEWLMVIGTASLIPLELYHFIHKPSFIKIIIISVNVWIVWYLWKTLKQNRKEAHKIKNL